MGSNWFFSQKETESAAGLSPEAPGFQLWERGLLWTDKISCSGDLRHEVLGYKNSSAQKSMPGHVELLMWLEKRDRQTHQWKHESDWKCTYFKKPKSIEHSQADEKRKSFFCGWWYVVWWVTGRDVNLSHTTWTWVRLASWIWRSETWYNQKKTDFDFDLWLQVYYDTSLTIFLIVIKQKQESFVVKTNVQFIINHH